MGHTMISSGIGKHAGMPVADTYTNKDGHYRFVIDVPKGYSRVIVGVGFNAGKTDENGSKAPYGTIPVETVATYDFELHLKSRK